MAMNARSVLITGAAGYLGSQLLAALAADEAAVGRIVAVDVRDIPAHRHLPGVEYCQADVRSAELAELFKSKAPNIVVHLASIVTPGKGSNREFEYSVDVLGSRNVLDACVAHGVQHIVVSSSGAAYGYHADNPAWLRESDALPEPIFTPATKAQTGHDENISFERMASIVGIMPTCSFWSLIRRTGEIRICSLQRKPCWLMA